MKEFLRERGARCTGCSERAHILEKVRETILQPVTIMVAEPKEESLPRRPDSDSKRNKHLDNVQANLDLCSNALQAIEKFSAKELKALLRERGVKCTGCSEKSHILQKVRETILQPVAVVTAVPKEESLSGELPADSIRDNPSYLSISFTYLLGWLLLIVASLFCSVAATRGRVRDSKFSEALVAGSRLLFCGIDGGALPHSGLRRLRWLADFGWPGVMLLAAAAALPLAKPLGDVLLLAGLSVWTLLLALALRRAPACGEGGRRRFMCCVCGEEQAEDFVAHRAEDCVCPEDVSTCRECAAKWVLVKVGEQLVSIPCPGGCQGRLVQLDVREMADDASWTR